MRPIRGLLLPLCLSGLLLGGGGCIWKYGFAGGGLPPGIRTVAVLPFENLTAEPTLTQEILRAVREAVESRLGLRPAGEDMADAVVRGTIQRFEPDIPVAYTGTTGQPVDVTSRLVQITVSVQIMNQRDGKVLWEKAGLMVQGDYKGTQVLDGRRKALDRLITDIVDGAQSQW